MSAGDGFSIPAGNTVPARCPECGGSAFRASIELKEVEYETRNDTETSVPGEPPKEVRIIEKFGGADTTLTCESCGHQFGSSSGSDEPLRT